MAIILLDDVLLKFHGYFKSVCEADSLCLDSLGWACMRSYDGKILPPTLFSFESIHNCSCYVDDIELPMSTIEGPVQSTVSRGDIELAMNTI